MLDAETTRRFAHWLSERVGGAVEVAGVATPKTGGGWSNETVILELVRGGPVVVRLQPKGPAMFQAYELGREYQVLKALSALDRPKVPRPIAIDPDGSVAGRPLFVMSHVAGRIPSDDRPSFAEAGWLFEASLDDQRTFYIGLLAAIADVHAVDWQPALSGLVRAAGHPLRAEVHWLRQLHLWGAGADRHPTIERGFERALRTMPPTPPPSCLLWGDARPANVVEAAFRPAALLDWELAGIGPAELDIAWFLEMNRMRTVGAGVPPLPGFLSDDETVACYQRLSGRTLADLAWYRRYAALRMAVLMERHLRVAIARGTLRQGHRLLKDNVALRRVEAL